MNGIINSRTIIARDLKFQHSSRLSKVHCLQEKNLEGQVHQIFLDRKNIQILEIQKIELRTKKFPSPRDPKSEFSDFRDRCTNFFIYFLNNVLLRAYYYTEI